RLPPRRPRPRRRHLERDSRKCVRFRRPSRSTFLNPNEKGGRVSAPPFSSPPSLLPRAKGRRPFRSEAVPAEGKQRERPRRSLRGLFAFDQARRARAPPHPAGLQG